MKIAVAFVLLSLVAVSLAARPGRFEFLTRVLESSPMMSNSSSPSNSTSSNSSANSNSTVGVVSLQRLITNLSRPIAVVTAIPPGQSREFMFVGLQTGQVLVLDVDSALSNSSYADMELPAFLILDVQLSISLNQDYDTRGLTGLAFHPNFQSNGRFWVMFDARNVTLSSNLHYSNDIRVCNASSACDGSAVDHATVLREFTLSNFPATLPMSSSNATSSNTSSSTNSSSSSTGSYKQVGTVTAGDVLIQIAKPFYNHNADNSLTVNPYDGWLYMGVGDGGCEVGRSNLALDKNSLFGKIIRFNVDQTAPSGGSNSSSSNSTNSSSSASSSSCTTAVQYLSEYRSTCASRADKMQVYAYGIRDPSALEFIPNPVPGAQPWAMVVPDVDAIAYNEINLAVDVGSFFGWSFTEGYVCINSSAPSNCTASSSNSTNSSSSSSSQDLFSASTASIADPIAVVSHDDLSLLNPANIVGGRVYNGTDIPFLRGKYVFATYASLKNNRTIGQAQLVYMDPSLLASSYRSLFNRTSLASRCSSLSNGTVDLSPLRGNTLQDPFADVLDVHNSPSGLRVQSMFLEYVFDMGLSRFTGSVGANSNRSQVFWAVTDSMSPVSRDGVIYRVIGSVNSPLQQHLK